MDVTTREVKQGKYTLQADMRRRAVRIRHPRLRNCIYTVVQFSVRYPVMYECDLCKLGHIFKTFHLMLNEHGDVTVSAEIYELFKREGMLTDIANAKEVVPRPYVIEMPTVYQRAQTTNGAEPTYFTPPVWQPPVVVSREDGLVKSPNEAISQGSAERISRG